MKIAALAPVLLMSAVAVSAAGADEPAATDSAREEKKICRTERMTGSLTRRTRICLTAEQWRELNDRTRKGLNEMSRDAAGGKVCVPNPADPFQGCN